jgi:UPF0755 protein
MRRPGILVLGFLVAAACFAAWVHWEISRPYKGSSEAKVFVDIPRGTSRRAIAALLERNGVVPNQIVFEAYSRWHQRKTLQAGEYLFDRPLTPREVFWTIAQGRIYVHTIAVPEGWTMFDIAQALEREGICRRHDFLSAAGNTSLIRDLAPDARSLEGFLFPATYEFSRHVTPQEIAAAMVERFRAVWQTLAPVDPENLSPEKAVTIASLVERETPRREERPVVAGVFYNRLRLGLPLQSDPTVQYALARAGRFVQTLSSADLSFPSPYNTYLRAGLPPGPIANPGEASLRAALEPAQTDYLYFVANDDGGHFFSRTLDEHNRNVARYRRRLAGLPETPAPPPPRRNSYSRRP